MICFLLELSFERYTIVWFFGRCGKKSFFPQTNRTSSNQNLEEEFLKKKKIPTLRGQECPSNLRASALRNSDEHIWNHNIIHTTSCFATYPSWVGVFSLARQAIKSFVYHSSSDFATYPSWVGGIRLHKQKFNVIAYKYYSKQYNLQCGIIGYIFDHISKAPKPFESENRAKLQSQFSYISFFF